MRHTALWFLKSQINDFSDIAKSIEQDKTLQVWTFSRIIYGI